MRLLNKTRSLFRDKASFGCGQGELRMRTRRWIAVNYAVQAGGVTAEDRSTNNAEQSSQEIATQDSQ
jgi:hypothetical protein